MDVYSGGRSHTRYFSEVSRARMPADAREERALFERYHEHGDPEARRLLVEGGLRFVIKTARQYYRGDTDFLNNLIAAGNVGLMVAVDRYRPWMIRCRRCDKHNYVAKPKHQRCQKCNRALRYVDAQRYTTRFLTYAAWWITEAIRTTLYDASPVHIPPYKQKEYHRARLAGKDAGFTYLSYEEAMALPPQSLTHQLVNDCINEDSDSEGRYAERHARKLLYRLLSMLKDRHAYVVIAYFGLREDRKTLREIAEKLGVCPERVRQIKEDALNELRNRLRQLKIDSACDVYWN